MGNLTALEQELNQLILQGKMMEAFEKFYAEDCHMQENEDAPCVGKDANRKREEEFLGNVEAFHSGNLVAWAVGDGVSFSEWEFDFTMKGAGRMQQTQIARRRWRDGKVVHERFFHK